jgi:hypothetical protein
MNNFLILCNKEIIQDEQDGLGRLPVKQQAAKPERVMYWVQYRRLLSTLVVFTRPLFLGSVQRLLAQSFDTPNTYNLSTSTISLLKRV